MRNSEDAPERRRQWRTDYVDQFLREIGVPREQLAKSTLECLDDWARQVWLVENQPSANWGSVFLYLCKAVESELASRFGPIQPLHFFAEKQALGPKIKKLNQTTPDISVKQQLETTGINPEFVFSDLSKKLSNLAQLRRKTDAAHGGAEILHATMGNAMQARDLASEILKGLHQS